MADGAQEDVTATLGELERKLIELERELATVAGRPPPDAPPRPAEPRTEELRGGLSELRERVRTFADDLVDRVDAIIAGLERPDGREHD